MSENGLRNWVCTKCGKPASNHIKPGTPGNHTDYGKCPKSSDKKHKWVER